MLATSRQSVSQDYSLAFGNLTRNYRTVVQPLSDWEDDPIGHVFEVRDVTESVLIEQRMRQSRRDSGACCLHQDDCFGFDLGHWWIGWS